MNRLTSALLQTGGNREKQNMLWNMAGSFCYAFASMVLAFLVMRIIGEDEGGIFGFGFSTLGQQMFILAYFGIRPFHITDGTGEYSFGEYLHHRYLTCGAALLCGGGYLLVFHNRYTGREMAVLFLLICYKVVDGFADVYETEFQRNGRLYLTGKSNTFRVILTVSTFLTALAVSHRYYLANPAVADNSLLIACAVAVAAQVLGVLIFDVPVLRELPTVAYEWGRGKLRPLFRNTGLLFVSVFLDFYVFSAVKYAIDAYMNNAASGYFNIIFMPTSVINLAAGLDEEAIRGFYLHAEKADAGDQRADSAGGGSHLGHRAAGAGDFGNSSGGNLPWEIDCLSDSVYLDCARRRILRGTQFILLCAGDSAEAETDLWYLCGDGGHCRRGVAVSGENGRNPGSGGRLPVIDDLDGGFVCGQRIGRLP